TNPGHPFRRKSAPFSDRTGPPQAASGLAPTLSLAANESRTRPPLCADGRGGPMPAERAPMRKVREVLRLKHALGLSERQIAVSVGVSRSTVAEYLRRAC